MEFEITVASCEEMVIDGKKYYKVYAVLPNGGLVRIRGCRRPVKPQETLTVVVGSQGDKYGFAPMLTVTDKS